MGHLDHGSIPPDPLDRLDSGAADELRDFLAPEGPPILTRDEAVRLLCRLQEAVAYSPVLTTFPSRANDCFCDPGRASFLGDGFQSSGDAVRFIIRATLDEIRRREAAFKPCVVEFCREEATATGTIIVPAEDGELAEDLSVEVGFCAEHFGSIVGDSTGLRLSLD